MLQDGAENVKDITGEPDDDELQGQAIGTAAAEVLKYLWREDDDPTCNGDGSRGQKSLC